MSSKLIASFVLAGGLAVAMGAGFRFLVGGLILGAALLLVALGQLALSHLAFFEERKRRLPRAVGPLPWVNMAMSYLLRDYRIAHGGGRALVCHGRGLRCRNHTRNRNASRDGHPLSQEIGIG